MFVSTLGVCLLMEEDEKVEEDRNVVPDGVWFISLIQGLGAERGEGSNLRSGGPTGPPQILN